MNKETIKELCPIKPGTLVMAGNTWHGDVRCGNQPHYPNEWTYCLITDYCYDHEHNRFLCTFEGAGERVVLKCQPLDPEKPAFFDMVEEMGVIDSKSYFHASSINHRGDKI